MKFISLILSLFLLAPICSFGQTDKTIKDSISLEPIEIVSDKLRGNQVGSQIVVWDKNKIEKLPTVNIGNILSQEGNIYVKQYGPGTLSTASVRGGNAGHNLTLWNGIPIGSPTLGLLDFSLIPAATIDEVSLERGGNSALWGSGAIGAVIQLNNQHKHPVLSQDRKIGLSLTNDLTIGSFGEFQESVGVGFGGKKLHAHSQYIYQIAENNYPYIPDPSLPKQRLTNAAQDQYHFLQHLYWTPNDKSKFAFHYWKQNITRAIPPTINQSTSVAQQIDKADRLTASWNYHNKNHSLKFNNGYYSELNRYQDANAGIDSDNIFKTYYSELVYTQFVGTHHKLLAGSNYTNTSAQTKSYQLNKPEHKMALFASHVFTYKKLSSQFSLRSEWVNGKLVPIIPNLGMNYQLSNDWTINIKAGKNYRLPTLNDRYWKPGGNIDLQPESGWSQELGVNWKKQKNNQVHQFSITGFNRNINDWIFWSKIDGQAFFRPFNITKVWSRGIETRYSYSLKHGAHHWRFNLMYDYILSTNQIALDFPRIAVNEQLWYTPKQQGQISINGTWHGLSYGYRHQFMGDSRGINADISAYKLGNINLGYQFAKWNKIQLKTSLRFNNIWDINYKIIERRPMPGRNFQINFQIKFN